MRQIPAKVLLQNTQLRWLTAALPVENVSHALGLYFHPNLWTQYQNN